MNKKTVKDVELSGKRVIMRADFNVPLKDGSIIDDARIKGALPTINYILEQKPKVLVLMSHLGRPKGERKPEFSLKPVADYLNEKLGGITFLNDCIGDDVEKAVASAEEGSVVLLENLRYHKEETKNDGAFSQRDA